MLQGNKELLPFHAGRMKEDHRADTMDESGSRAGPRSRERNGIPPRPGLREASEDREVTALPGLPLRREGKEDRTFSNGYKNVLDLIITLVVVNLNSSSLTQIVN